LEAATKRKSSRLLDAARECWALACWLTLRRTWAQWEQERAGVEGKAGARDPLPPPVEAFFGRYAHTTFCRWTPIVARETVTRKERDRLKRKAAKEEATREEADFDKLTKVTDTEEEPKVESSPLLAKEEVFGLLADEFELEYADTEADLADEQSADRRFGSQDIKLAFHDLQIEEPERPRDAKDRTPWMAWSYTQEVLWEPRTNSRRVYMNELFKQPLNKPTATATDMLRCLTGYLKTIVREAVREQAKEAIRTKGGSNESVTSLDAAVPGSTTGDSRTGMDVVPGREDTALTVMGRELMTWGQRVARDEFFAAVTSDGVRLSYFLESLKKADGSKHGFVVSISDAAILEALDARRATLNDNIKKCRKRLQQAADEHADALGADSELLMQWLELRIKEVAVEWFWSEKIPALLFGTVMDIIRTEHDPRFSCPLVTVCAAQPASALETGLCHECSRKQSA